MSTPTQPEKLRPFLGDSFRFFKAHITPLLQLALPMALLTWGMQTLVDQYYLNLDRDPLWPLERMTLPVITSLLLNPLQQGAMIVLITSIIAGTPRSTAQCYRIALSFWPRMVYLSIVVNILILCGFFLFFIPGIIVLGRLALADIHCMTGQCSAIASMERSFHSTAPQFRVILVGLLMLFVLITPLSVLVSSAVAASSIPGLSLLNTVLHTVLQSLPCIFLYRVFSDTHKASKA